MDCIILTATTKPKLLALAEGKPWTLRDEDIFQVDHVSTRMNGTALWGAITSDGPGWIAIARVN